MNREQCYVNPLVFDSAVWEASQHHIAYLSENGYPDNYVCSSGHHELELVEFTDRLRHYGVKVKLKQIKDNNLFKTYVDKLLSNSLYQNRCFVNLKSIIKL